MAKRRNVLAITVLVGLLLLLVVLSTIGRERAAVAPVPASTSTEGESRSPGRIEPPQKAGDDPTRETVPTAPAPSTEDETRAVASVSGIVLDADTESPIESFEIVHSPTGAGGTYVDTLFGFELAEVHPALAFSGSGGRFTLTELGSDARNVAVVAPGYEIAKIQVVEDGPDGDHEDLVFRMRRAATVRGRVIDLVSGAPVEGALVAWIDDGGQARTGPKERFERTDALGRFSLDYVPSGPRRLLAGREDLGQAFSPQLELQPGAVAGEVVIELGGSGPK